MGTIVIGDENLMLDFKSANYSHTLNAIGGPTTARFTIKGLSERHLSSIFDRIIGRSVKAYVSGIAVFTGYIARMDYTTGGVVYRRSLEYSQFVNSVNVFYSNDIGERKSTGWKEDALSIALYGRSAYVASLGGATDEQAERYAQQILSERSRPMPRLVGAGSDKPKIEVTAIGDWGLAGRLYRETTEHGAASSIIAKLAGEVGYRVKRVYDNPMVVKVDCTYAQRYADLFRYVVEQGDDDLRRYRLEVMENSIVYEPVSLKYNWNGGIVRLGGVVIDPALVKAGAFIAASSSGTSGEAYISQLTYSVQSGLQLSLLELTGRAAALSAQIMH